MMELNVDITKDEYTAVAEEMFDCKLEDKSTTIINDNIEIPKEWNIGVIWGTSGCGKSHLLEAKFGKPFVHNWDNSISMISNFREYLSPKEASELLCAVGLSTVPSWVRPYSCLSMGEKFRADMAMAIAHNDDIICIDEFTSVVDRDVAKAVSYTLQKYIRKTNRKLVVASCHHDILEWLNADFSFNPTSGETTPRGCLCRPKIELQIFRTKYETWELFKHHHYLSADLNKASKIFTAYWNDKPVAMCAVLPQPSGWFKNGWRVSRLVVLPEFQGLGIGVQLADYVAKLCTKFGGIYFIRSVHPACAMHNLASDDWEETSHSGREVGKSKGFTNYKLDTRLCYAFKYVGETDSVTNEEAELFYKSPNELKEEEGYKLFRL